MEFLDDSSQKLYKALLKPYITNPIYTLFSPYITLYKTIKQLRFGEPISTEEYGGDADNTEFAKEVRDKTKAAIEKGGEGLLRLLRSGKKVIEELKSFLA